MPEPRDIPLVRWGEELRRHRRAGRTARLRILLTIAAALAGTAAAATLLWPPRPVLVWNVSASSPLGLYRVSPAGNVRPGATVVALAPAAARVLAGKRGYIPSSVPLVKHVAAARGDRVCAAGEAVFVNGRLAGSRRSEDAAGRSLPWWTGCKDLKDGELFLLTAAGPASFDGRYFGVTEPGDVVGRARLLWSR